MDRIAIIDGETLIYWNDIILTLAAVCAICLYVGFYLIESGNGLAAAASVPLGLELSILGARLVHWYCRPDSYISLEAAIFDMSNGDFALMGVFAGVILTAVILRLLHISKNLPQMLDAMALGGCAAIAVGRLAAMFTANDRGLLLEGITSLPLAYPVVDVVTGAVQYRLATFYLQAVAAAGIFAIVLLFYLPGRLSRRMKCGDTALLFCSLYGASQALLDSTRYDSLFLRSNGFVSIVQILGAVGVVVPLVFFSCRRCYRAGFKWWYIPFWVLAAAAIGGAGYMEYYVQRHGDQAAYAYRNMTACLIVTLVITLLFWFMSMTKKRHRKKAKKSKAEAAASPEEAPAEEAPAEEAPAEEAPAEEAPAEEAPAEEAPAEEAPVEEAPVEEAPAEEAPAEEAPAEEAPAEEAPADLFESFFEEKPE